jgi:hypothetical protein
MKRYWVIIGIVLTGAFLLIPHHVRQDLGWVDSIGGSRKSQTVWRYGAPTAPVLTESPLAERYRALGLQWEPDWKSVKGTYVDVFGRSVGHEHGFAPEIYSLAMHPDLQRAFLAKSSDDDVRAFFRVMLSGSEAEKKAAVEAACDKALGD